MKETRVCVPFADFPDLPSLLPICRSFLEQTGQPVYDDDADCSFSGREGACLFLQVKAEGGEGRERGVDGDEKRSVIRGGMREGGEGGVGEVHVQGGVEKGVV